MSDETKADLDKAITAHFTDQWDGGFVIGWVLQVAGKTSEDIDAGQTSYSREVLDGQPAHVTLGLLDFAHTKFRDDL